MILSSRVGIPVVTLLTAISLSPIAAHAWPDRPIHVVVPFSAGSAVDTIPRIVLEQLSAELHQPIVVENRPGAGGTIGSNAVARSTPDGYLLLATTSSHTVAPFIYRATAYDSGRDFAGIVPLGSIPNVLVVSPASRFKKLAELVAAARDKPGTITFASAGIGSATHFSAELFRLSAGLNLIHVPFKGAPEAYNEVLGGRVDFYFGALTTAMPLIKSGQLAALAVNSRARVAQLPDVPTTEEAGFADSEYTFWVGLFAPIKTPRAIVEQLHDRIQVILESPLVREKLKALSIEPMPMSSAEFDVLVRQEGERNKQIVTAAGIKPE